MHELNDAKLKRKRRVFRDPTWEYRTLIDLGFAPETAATILQNPRELKAAVPGWGS